MPFKNKAQQIEYQRQWMAKRRASYFADKTCVICNSTINLELDHIDPNLKISHRIWSWSNDRRLAEIAKCQVLCEVHHKVKTLEQTRTKTHGVSMYRSQKCRCDICRKARTVAESNRRQRKNSS
jgi:hypothetical protein